MPKKSRLEPFGTTPSTCNLS